MPYSILGGWQPGPADTGAQSPGLTVPALERCLRRCKAARKSLQINIRTEAQHGHRVEACFTPKRLWTRLLFGLKRRPQQLPETLCRAMSWGHLPCLLPAAGWVSSLFTPKKTTNKKHDLKAQQWRLTCSPSPTVRNYSFQLNNLLRKIYSRLPAAIQLPASQWRGNNTHPSIHPSPCPPAPGLADETVTGAATDSHWV